MGFEVVVIVVVVLVRTSYNILVYLWSRKEKNFKLVINAVTSSSGGKLSEIYPQMVSNGWLKKDRCRIERKTRHDESGFIDDEREGFQ